MHLKPHLLAALAFVACCVSPAFAQTEYPPQKPLADAIQSRISVGSLGVVPDMSQAATLGTPLAQVTSVPAVPPAEGTTPTPPAQPAALGPPFQLSDTDQAYVDQILQMWENTSKEIKTFDSPFDRWEYDPVFGPADVPAIKSRGQLSYSKPDKGSFKINEIERYVQKDPAKPALTNSRNRKSASIGSATAKRSTSTSTTRSNLSYRPCPSRCVVNRSLMGHCRSCSAPRQPS